MATGRRDYPNQISNMLAFRGALDAGEVQISEEMKLAAARAIVDLEEEPTAECIVPPSPRRASPRPSPPSQRTPAEEDEGADSPLAHRRRHRVGREGGPSRAHPPGPRRRHQCLLVPPLSAELWRLLVASSRPEADLQAKGAELADESGRDLVEAFIEAMTHHDLIESVASGT